MCTYSICSSERNEIQSVVKLLNIPLSTFSVVVVLDLQIAKILEYLDYNTRKRVAIDFMKSLVENETYITEPDILKRMFEFVSPITHDQGKNHYIYIYIYILLPTTTVDSISTYYYQEEYLMARI